MGITFQLSCSFRTEREPCIVFWPLETGGGIVPKKGGRKSGGESLKGVEVLR